MVKYKDVKGEENNHSTPKKQKWKSKDSDILSMRDRYGTFSVSNGEWTFSQIRTLIFRDFK